MIETTFANHHQFSFVGNIIFSIASNDQLSYTEYNETCVFILILAKLDLLVLINCVNEMYCWNYLI